MNHTTREDWLAAALAEARPLVNALTGLTVPDRIRVSCALPSTYRRSGALGETWHPQASEDAHYEVMISPTLASPAPVFAQLLHEVLHACLGTNTHPAAFGTAAQALRLDAAGPTSDTWARTVPSATWDGFWGEIVGTLGDYPHGALLAGTAIQKAPTRMIKCWCPSCGFTFRATEKHIKTGLPTCGAVLTDGSKCGDTFVSDFVKPTVQTAEE